MHLNQGMEAALNAAKKAFSQDEVPVGATLLDKNGHIIATNHNRTIELTDPTAHAELLVLKEAFALQKTPYLQDFTLCVTLEPCAMCAQAISHARVGTLCFGAHDVKSGGVFNGARIFEHAHFKPKIYDGILEEDCGSLLREFFKNKR
jgi:tRNA(Arg) A34 adenosine deaminase TadA